MLNKVDLLLSPEMLAVLQAMLFSWMSADLNHSVRRMCIHTVQHRETYLSC